MQVKVIIICHVEKTVDMTKNNLVICKTTAVIETSNFLLTFYRTWSLVAKERQIYNITHVMVRSRNYKCILKTIERTIVPLCEDRNIEIDMEIMTSIPSTIKETKIVALLNDLFWKMSPCPKCMSSVIPDEDDIIECSCGVIASVEAAIPRFALQGFIVEVYKLSKTNSRRHFELEVS